MKEHLRLVMGLLFDGILLWGCQGAVIPHPGFPEAEDDTVLLDFTYRVSTSYRGFVKFQQISQNIKTYQWTFGFLDANGNLATSTAASPGVFFPANGNYTVVLKGTTANSDVVSVTKIVTITNF